VPRDSVRIMSVPRCKLEGHIAEMSLYGSLAFLQRNRTSHFSKLKSFPKDDASNKPHLTAFRSYKAGMTHIVHHVDRPGSKLHKKEIAEGVSVLVAPPMVVVGFVRPEQVSEKSGSPPRSPRGAEHLRRLLAQTTCSTGTSLEGEAVLRPKLAQGRSGPSRGQRPPCAARLAAAAGGHGRRPERPSGDVAGRTLQEASRHPDVPDDLGATGVRAPRRAGHLGFQGTPTCLTTSVLQVSGHPVVPGT